jgi:hypothetical protein
MAELTALLPGSEPKDTTSPFRGLGKRGEALIANFQEGIDKTPILLPEILSSSMNNQTNWNVSINTQQPVNDVLSGLEMRQQVLSL